MKGVKYLFSSAGSKKGKEGGKEEGGIGEVISIKVVHCLTRVRRSFAWHVKKRRWRRGREIGEEAEAGEEAEEGKEDEGERKKEKDTDNEQRGRAHENESFIQTSFQFPNIAAMNVNTITRTHIRMCMYIIDFFLFLVHPLPASLPPSPSLPTHPQPSLLLLSLPAAAAAAASSTTVVPCLPAAS